MKIYIADSLRMEMKVMMSQGTKRWGRALRKTIKRWGKNTNKNTLIIAMKRRKHMKMTMLKTIPRRK